MLPISIIFLSVLFSGIKYCYTKSFFPQFKEADVISYAMFTVSVLPDQFQVNGLGRGGVWVVHV